MLDDSAGAHCLYYFLELFSCVVSYRAVGCDVTDVAASNNRRECGPSNVLNLRSVK
jgi:hypothetical protein